MKVDFTTEPSAPGGPGQAVASLRGLLELTRLTRRQRSLPEVLDAVARTVSQSLGFRTVVINDYRPEAREYEVVAVHGSDRARGILLGSVSTEDRWAPMLDPRFRRHGVYFIPEGALELDPSLTWYTPDLAPDPAATDRAWRADDAVFATLDGSEGRRYGIISVDDPDSGLRPEQQQLEVLGALAAHAALAIESSRQLAALERSLARNRAVITSTLECVIAIDQAGKVIEFNPASERTFGYRSEDAIGRDLAELIIPPGGREAHRRGLAHGIATGRWRLLGRRIEMNAMRSDGSQFPVELTLTLVDGANGEGAVFYGFVRDISERRRGEEQLSYLAYHDLLTGLPNRVLVEQQVDLALARARRVDGAVALMFVDLDDFKEVNDRLGHDAGDRLLAGVAARQRSVLRDSDLLARQGGDEFLVLLTDLTDDPTVAAENVGGKLLDALREPFVVAATEVRTSASIGVSLYPDDAADTETLLRHADAAMYVAKAAGGGRIAFHERSEGIVSRRSSLAAQLRLAIAQGQLELHYQPVWLLHQERRIAGVEALLRWRHPDRGLLTPEAFVNLAEQTTAGNDLVAWVLGETCRQARAWQVLGLVPLIAMSVSPHQLLASGYAARLVDQVHRYGLDPGRLVIEVTESAWTVDAAPTLSVIADLRATGTILALDDFGAGYSSLSRLRELDFDLIKIDRGLLVDVPGDETAVAVLEAVFALAAACGPRLIAKGVETEEQVAFLIAHGVTCAQGFLFGQPMAAEEITPLLARFLVTGLSPGPC